MPASAARNVGLITSFVVVLFQRHAGDAGFGLRRGCGGQEHGNPRPVRAGMFRRVRDAGEIGQAHELARVAV